MVKLIGPYSCGNLLFLKAITNLHPGAGRGGEVVDLSVQRDCYGFPVIWASSLKGAIKSFVWYKNNALANVLFGPEDDEEKFSSPIAILDAYLLFFPVRSLKGVYCYVTSPLLLKRFKATLDFLSSLQNGSDNIKNLSELTEEVLNNKKNEKILAGGDYENLKINDKIILNEEIEIKNSDIDNNVDIVNKLLNFLENNVNLKDLNALLVVNDDDAKLLIERSLIRVTRIRLDRQKKVVKEGSLWTEEYVPINSIFYTAMLGYSKEVVKNFVNNSNKKEINNLGEILNKGSNKTILDIILKDNEYKLEYIIVGGHESIGKGLIKIYVL